MRIPVAGKNLFSLLFADDQVLIAQDEEDISYMVRKLIEEYKKDIGRNSTALTTDSSIIQTCEEYKYLGVVITSKGTSDRDIITRIAQLN